jgi:hypothetical protein
VFTYIRSKDYMPLLKQLVCTFREHNPGVELGVMLVPGELGTDAVQWMQRKNLTLVEVPPLNYPNHFNPRWARRAWFTAASQCAGPKRALVQPLCCQQAALLSAALVACSKCHWLAAGASVFTPGAAGTIGPAQPARMPGSRRPSLLALPPTHYACVPVCRYGRNRLKLRALSLTQYDSVLLIDSDVAVVGNVTPLLSLPVEFAASWDQSRWLGK